MESNVFLPTEALPETLEETDALIKLTAFNCLLYFCDQIDLVNPSVSTLLNGANIITRDQLVVTKGYMGAQVSAENPQALLVYGASLCTLLLNFDLDGNAVALHSALSGSPREFQRDSLEGFNKAIKTKVNRKNNLTVITATNPTTEKERLARPQLIQDIVALTPNSKKHTALLVKPEESVYLTQKDNDQALNRIGSFVFIPQQLSRSKQHELLIFSDGSLVWALKKSYFGN